MTKNYDITQGPDIHTKINLNLIAMSDTYSSIKDAETLCEFLDNLPTQTVDALTRRLLKERKLSELESYLERRREDERLESYQKLHQSYSNPTNITQNS
jgi:hypothetical protein